MRSVAALLALVKKNAGWGEVFRQMKAQGFVTDKNLGQAVSNFEHHHPELAAKPDNAKPDKLEKPDELEKPDKPEKIEKPARPCEGIPTGRQGS